MKTIIINGANGYVASNLINNLLKQNCRVVALVRRNKKHTSQERMRSVLDDINDGMDINTSNLEVYDYSLLENDFLMTENDLKNIFQGTVDYFHFAASLKYDEKSMDEIFSSNVEGVKNSIRIFSKYATENSRFFYIGTAYSCGKFDGIFAEKFYENKDISAFRNYYEQSKRFGENVVKKNIQENGLNAYVIRFSQVIGEHRTGVVKTDYGIFDFAKRVYSLSQRYPNEKVRIYVEPTSTQNLIPIDTVTEHLTKLVKEKNVPQIMNFVAKESIQNIHIINSLNQLLPINIIPLKELDKKEMNAIERLISAGMAFTKSYASTNLLFDTQQRDGFVNDEKTDPDNESVDKMLAYFIKNLSKSNKKQTSIVA